MTKYRITYGTEKLELEFPEEFLAGEMVVPKEPQPPKDGLTPYDRIVAALENPVGMPKIPEIVDGKRVAIVVSDEFRSGRQKDITYALIEQVSKGNPASVNFIIATGSHDPAIYAVHVAQWAKDAAERYGLDVQILEHDCDESEFIFVGNTSRGSKIYFNKAFLEAEVRIYGHEAKHHYMCGYSNIDKLVVPGVSARITIENNHKLALQHKYSQAGRSPWHKDPDRHRNPFAEDAHEAREMAIDFVIDPDTRKKLEGVSAVEFGLDMVSDTKEVYWVRAGELGLVEQEMTAVVDEMAMFEFEPVRYVVVSPGGPPASQTIYSTQNCFDMALKGAILQNGEALVLAPCDGRPDVPDHVRGIAPDEKSKKLFWDNLVNLVGKDLDEASRFIDENFELYLWKTDRVLKLFKESGIKVYLYSKLPPELVRQGGFIPVDDPQAWIEERAGRKDGTCRVIDKGNKMLIMPKRH